MATRPTHCRCGELGQECPACLAEMARIEDREGDPMPPGDYERLDAGPWWNCSPDMTQRSPW
jgi:hypothetical protein